MSNRKIKHFQVGFTLIELVVISPILILAITAILAATLTLTSQTATSNENTAIIHESNVAVNDIEDQLNLTGLFLQSKENEFTDTYGSDNAGTVITYSGASANQRALVLRTYATSVSPQNDTKTPVYIDQQGCTATTIGSNPVLSANTIYFVRNQKLYRRTLVDTSKPLCTSLFQKQSCPIDVGSRSNECMANDVMLAEGVKSFTVSYYASSQDDTPVDAYNSSDNTILDTATTIKVDITIEKSIAGNTLTKTSSVRISRPHL